MEKNKRELAEKNLRAMTQERDTLEEVVQDLRQALRDAQDRDRKSPENLLRAEIARLKGEAAQKDTLISEVVADKHKVLTTHLITLRSSLSCCRHCWRRNNIDHTSINFTEP